MRPGLSMQVSIVPLEFLAKSRTRVSTPPCGELFSKKILLSLLLEVGKRMLDTHSHQAIIAHHPWFLSLVTLSVSTAHIQKSQRLCFIASRELGKSFEASNGILQADLSDFIPRHSPRLIRSYSHKPVLKKRQRLKSLTSSQDKTHQMQASALDSFCLASSE